MRLFLALPDAPEVARAFPGLWFAAVPARKRAVWASLPQLHAAYPSVNVHGYYRSTGTYVAPHVRTAPNGIVTDNLSYCGYGTIRVPKSSYRW
jgi:hypothetical protein